MTTSPTLATADAIRVLHVDDEPRLTDLAASHLERHDDRITVRTATGAEEALATLAEWDVDCVVSDYEMPGTNGIELLETVRERSPDLPFVLYTGKGSEEVASDAISAGVTDYLQKTRGVDQYAILANRVRNAVERARARRTQQRQLDAIEAAEEGISILDEAGRFVHVNEAYADLYGYDPDELVGEHWERIYPEEDVPRIREEVLPAVAATGRWEGTTTGLRADGTTFVEDHTLAATGDGELVCTVRDITARVERERKLDRLRDRSQRLMYTATRAETAQVATDAADDIIGAPLSGVHLLDDDGDALVPAATVASVDDVFDDPLRYERDAPKGSRAALVWGVFEDGDPLTIDDVREYGRLTEPTPARSVILHPLGDHGVFIVSSDEPDAFDETDRTLVDILATFLTTGLDRLRREQRRREREDSLERLHAATRSLMAAETRAAIAEEAVAAAEGILGFPIVTVRLFDEDVGGLVPVAASDAVADLLPERPVFTPDGGSLNWDVYESGEAAVFDDVNQADGAVDAGTALRSLLVLPLGDHGTLAAGKTTPSAFDESDRFLAEILATATETALNRADREAALRRQRDELEQRNERLDEFTSVVSHDLRNPLNVAEGYLDLAREDCPSEHHDAVADAHERMRGLVDGLLALAQEGDATPAVEAVDLGALVERCWENVATADATLVTETDRRVRADPERLKQLLENLVRNAVEHGGDDVTIRVGTVEDGFYVADDGPGIPDGARDQVFERGYSTVADGIGFGLAIVAEVADAHGWTVAATEGADGGARFEVTGVEWAD